MTADPMIERDHLVADLRGAVSEGESGLDYVPRLILRVIETEAWRERYDAKCREMVAFDSFSEFVSADPTGGLGTSADRIKRLVEGTDAEGPVGRMLKGEIEPARPPRLRDSERTTLRTETADRHLARLKRDDPALAQQVVNGDMSAYAAARAKGWKPPRIQVTTPQRTAGHLRKHMTADQLAELARLLADENE